MQEVTLRHFLAFVFALIYVIAWIMLNEQDFLLVFMDQLGGWFYAYGVAMYWAYDIGGWLFYHIMSLSLLVFTGYVIGTFFDVLARKLMS